MTHLPTCMGGGGGKENREWQKRCGHRSPPCEALQVAKLMAWHWDLSSALDQEQSKQLPGRALPLVGFQRQVRTLVS